MMADNSEAILDIINASGFLFQLRIEHEIRQTQHEREGRWGIEAREYRWSDPISGKEGFIDLILKAGVGRMVVECKRVTEGRWVFLIPDNNRQESRARLLWTHGEPDQESLSGWSEFEVAPASPESAFCIVRGQGEKDPPMLERISSMLMRSLESLADEEMNFRVTHPSRAARVYFPVIVTNANLDVCYFHPGDIDLSAGMLPDRKFQYESASLVRFRKSLSTTKPSQQTPESLSAAAEENQRTVFIINATSLSTVLREWQLRHGVWPWMVYRARNSAAG